MKLTNREDGTLQDYPRDPPPAPESIRLLEQGQALAHRGDTDAAVRIWQSCIERYPDCLQAYGHLAWLFYSTGQYSEAQATYRKLLSLDPRDTEARFCLALVLLRLGRLESAFAQYENARQRLQSAGSKSPRHWKKHWREETRECRGNWLKYRLQRVLHKHPGLGWWVEIIQSALALAERGALAIYEPFARRKLLPLYCLERRPFCFSINDYLRFLSRHLPEDQKRVAYGRVAETALVTEALGRVPGARVLDMGTGTNPLPLYWVRRGMHVTCTDPDRFIFLLKSKAERLGLGQKPGDGRLSITVADGTRLPFEDGSFDFWTSVSVVEHIPEAGDGQTLQEAARVLKPGGIALLTTEGGPRHEDFWQRIPGYFGRPYPQFFEDVAPEASGFSEAVNRTEGFEQKGEQASVALCREYDYPQIIERLVKPSGLDVIEIGFLDRRFKADLRAAVDLPVRPWWGVLLAQCRALVCYWSYRRLEASGGR